MKNGKKIFVAVLVLALAIAAFAPTTFSWYDHNDALTGNKMSYYREDLPVSAGTVALETKKYRMDGNKIYYDKKGNKEYAQDQSNMTSVANGTTQYYGTTITNTGSAPAYVNLYLQNITHHPKNYIGTIAPSLTHKGMSSSVHIANQNLIRVYFQVKNTNNWSDASAKTYLVYKTKTDASYANKEITKTITLANNIGQFESSYKVYYVDLEPDTTEFFFATDGNNSGFDADNNTVTQNWYRTNTITDIQAEVGYYLTGYADDTTWRAQYATTPISGGISIKTYFDTADVAVGQNAYVTLAQGTNYTGKSAAYTTTDESISVNNNTGLITNNRLNQGSSTATVTTTITGSLGDTASVNTTVSNQTTLPAAAVALNVKVPGKKTVDGEVVNGTAEVVWYITNKSGADCTFNSVYYTK